MRAARLGALLCGALLLSNAPSVAEPPDGICHGYGALSDGITLRFGRINDRAPRTSFVKGSDEDEVCPSADVECRAKAFLVPGDLVILGAARGAFLCVDYIGRTGQERVGWFPADAVAPEPAPPPKSADWIGTWTREEASIVVEAAAKPGALAVNGDATYGAKDPDRVKRGGVNIGAIAGTAVPAGADLAFTMGQDATLPVNKGGQYDCKVWMKRLGPWLLVDDNNNCGGFNVTFRGTYVRAALVTR